MYMYVGIYIYIYTYIYKQDSLQTQGFFSGTRGVEVEANSPCLFAAQPFQVSHSHSV